MSPRVGSPLPPSPPPALAVVPRSTSFPVRQRVSALCVARGGRTAWWRGGLRVSAERASGWRERRSTPPSRSLPPSWSRRCSAPPSARSLPPDQVPCSIRARCGEARGHRTTLSLSAFISRLVGLWEPPPGLGWLHEAGLCRPCCAFSAGAVPQSACRDRLRPPGSAVAATRWKLRSRCWG